MSTTTKPGEEKLMPTPTGLPTKGDRFKHRDGVVFTIVHREGAGINYSVIAKREDGQPANGNHAYGYPKDHIRITEFAWYVKQGLFQEVKP
jgi:hypothetical protein